MNQGIEGAGVSQAPLSTTFHTMPLWPVLVSPPIPLDTLGFGLAQDAEGECRGGLHWFPTDSVSTALHSASPSVRRQLKSGWVSHRAGIPALRRWCLGSAGCWLLLTRHKLESTGKNEFSCRAASPTLACGQTSRGMILIGMGAQLTAGSATPEQAVPDGVRKRSEHAMGSKPVKQ